MQTFNCIIQTMFSIRVLKRYLRYPFESNRLFDHPKFLKTDKANKLQRTKVHQLLQIYLLGYGNKIGNLIEFNITPSCILVYLVKIVIFYKYFFIS